jgi:hypothetical protein
VEKSSRLKKEDGDLSHVEVNEVFSFMGHVRSEVSANHAVPCGVVLLVKLFLDVGCDVFLNVELLQGYICTVNRVLLHFLVHVCVFDDGFAFCC